jgi:NitT/TauT family transport system substrate-binding protein
MADDAKRAADSGWRRWAVGLAPLVFVAALVGILCARPGNAPAPQARIRIGIATWAGFASGKVGADQGLMPGIDLEYQTIDDLPARQAAFRSGRLDVMISSVDQYAQEWPQGLKGKVFLVTDESHGGDGILAKDGIKTLGDLRGKRVAYARSTPSHYLLYKALARAGLTPRDIERVEVEDPGNAGQAFLGGSVDAAVTWEPFLSQVRDSGKGHVLASSAEFPGSIVDILVASESLAAKHELLGRFIDGWLAGVASIGAHPAQAAPAIARLLKTKPEDVSGMMAGLRLADAERNRYFLCSGPDLDRLPIAEVLKDAAGFWKQEGLIQSLPDPRGVISTRLCETIRSGSGSAAR